jgi:hypothetical protein
MAGQPRKYHLEPEAQIALGKVSPERALSQVQSQVSRVVEEFYEAGTELVRRCDVPGGVQMDAVDIQRFLGNWDPVWVMNLLVDSNPDLDLKHIMEYQPLQILKAVLNLLESSRYQLIGDHTAPPNT